MGLISDGKAIFDAIQKYKNPDLVNKLIEYQDKVLALEDEKKELIEKCEKLEKALEIKGNLTFEAPFYRMKDDPTPFCATCWEVNNIAIHLIYKGKYNGDRDKYDCHHCEKSVYLQNNESSGSGMGAVWGRSSKKLMRS